MRVSIPSLSGLRFNGSMRHKWQRSGVSIPSLSGLRFNCTKVPATGSTKACLNPFFIRASFQRTKALSECQSPKSQSLLYQGFVSTQRQANIVRLPAGVSIPSLSGLRFNSRSDSHRWPQYSLNPFFIRASFQQSDEFNAARDRRLNPFFIRASFQPLAVVTPFPFNPIQTHFPILSALRQVHLASLWKTRTSQRPLLSILQPGRTRWTETTLSECNESGTSRLRARAER